MDSFHRITFSCAVDIFVTTFNIFLTTLFIDWLNNCQTYGVELNYVALDFEFTSPWTITGLFKWASECIQRSGYDLHEMGLPRRFPRSNRRFSIPVFIVLPDERKEKWCAYTCASVYTVCPIRKVHISRRESAKRGKSTSRARDGDFRKRFALELRRVRGSQFSFRSAGDEACKASTSSNLESETATARISPANDLAPDVCWKGRTRNLNGWREREAEETEEVKETRWRI